MACSGFKGFIGVLIAGSMDLGSTGAIAAYSSVRRRIVRRGDGGCRGPNSRWMRPSGARQRAAGRSDRAAAAADPGSAGRRAEQPRL